MPRSYTPKYSHKTFDGIDVLIVSGGVKKFNLRIRPDASVRLSIPSSVRPAQVDAFILDHLDWIKNTVLKTKQKTSANKPSKEEITRDKEILSQLLPALFAKYEPILKIQCTDWRTRYMISRWGSCNVESGKITINTELAHLPKFCLESVVVHELCHLRIRSHNSEFYALMESVYPKWREARIYLNTHPPRR